MKRLTGLAGVKEEEEEEEVGEGGVSFLNNFQHNI